MARPSTGRQQVIEAPTSARGQQTRAAIIAAARELFEQHGYEAVRIAEISKAAGVAHGSLYTYFGSKFEILQAVADAFNSTMLNASYPQQRGDASTIGRIREATRNYFQAYGVHAKMFDVLAEVSRRHPEMAELGLRLRDPFVDRIARGIERLQREGAVDAGLDARLVANLLGGMIEQSARLQHMGERVDREAVIDTATLLWARALGLDVDEDSVRAASRESTR
jgi:AcrR family transcriptional regulator